MNHDKKMIKAIKAGIKEYIKVEDNYSVSCVVPDIKGLAEYIKMHIDAI